VSGCASGCTQCVRDAIARFPIRRARVFAYHRARFCPRFLPGVYVSAVRRFKVRWCGYLNVSISPMDVGFTEGVATLASFGGGSSSTSWKGGTPNIQILVRRRSLRHRYRSVEAAFALPSGLWISQGFLDIRFACLLTSSASQEELEGSGFLCRREPVLYSVNYSRRRIRELLPPSGGKNIGAIRVRPGEFGVPSAGSQLSAPDGCVAIIDYRDSYPDMDLRIHGRSISARGS